MQPDRTLFFLLSLTNETLSELEELPEAEAEDVCSQLREILFSAANIPTMVGSHAWRAKLHLTRRLLHALVDDRRRKCLPSTDLMHKLFCSILQDVGH